MSTALSLCARISRWKQRASNKKHNSCFCWKGAHITWMFLEFHHTAAHEDGVRRAAMTKTKRKEKNSFHRFSSTLRESSRWWRWEKHGRIENGQGQGRETRAQQIVESQHKKRNFVKSCSHRNHQFRDTFRHRKLFGPKVCVIFVVNRAFVEEICVGNWRLLVQSRGDCRHLTGELSFPSNYHKNKFLVC